MNESDIGAVQSPRERWIVLVVIGMATLVITVDTTILNVALPAITRSLGASASELQWIVDSYTLVFACLLLVAGALGDRYGRKLTLVGGLAWFGVASVYAAIGHSPLQLIIGRALMGLGAAFIFPSTLSILTSTFREPVERAKAIGIWVAINSLAMVIGPLTGGVLVDHLGWHSVFYVNVPLCLLAVVGVVRFVRDTERDRSARLDIPGAVLSIAAMSLLLLAIIEAPEWGWTDVRVIGAAIGAVVLTGSFVSWERRAAHPMLEMSLFSNRVFTSASLSVTMTVFAMAGASLLTTVYFQVVEGYSALKTGMLMIPIAVAMMVIGPQVGGLVNRYGTRAIMTAGLGAIFVSLLLYSSNIVMSSFWLGAIPRFLQGVGMGLVMPPATMAIMSSLPPERAGVGSAMNDMTRQTGGALGIAVVGSVVASAYHTIFTGPAGTPAAAIEQARESVGRAVLVSERLPEGVGSAVAAAGRDAYVQAVRYGYWAGAVVIVLTTIFVRRNVTAIKLDHSRPVEADEVDLALG